MCMNIYIDHTYFVDFRATAKVPRGVALALFFILPGTMSPVQRKFLGIGGSCSHGLI